MPTPDEILAEMRRKVRSFGIGAGREWELVNHIEAWIAERTATQEPPERRTARRCAEIAKLHDESAGAGGETATAISLAIAREFGLNGETDR